MALIDKLLATLPDGLVWDIRVGVFWTAVVVEVDGLASTLRDDADHHHGGGPAVREAGMLLGHSARELAELVRSYHPMEAAIGMSTINALLPRQEKQWVDLKRRGGDCPTRCGQSGGAGRPLSLHSIRAGASRRLIGVGATTGRREDLPAEAACDVIPRADVVAITGTACDW